MDQIISEGTEEVWHVPHEQQPNKPLCGVPLTGKLRRTKGLPNCRICRAHTIPYVALCNYPILHALMRGESVSSDAERCGAPDELYVYDLVFKKKGRMALTNRGKLVAADVVEPVGWFDKHTGIYHARSALQYSALCGVACGDVREALDDPFKAFRVLMAEGSKHRGHGVTCVYCATYAQPQYDLD